MLKIAVGPGGDGPEWTNWTETIMKAYQHHPWDWDINGLSMHLYTVVKWPPSYASVGFGETEYAQILKSTPEMDGLIAKHSAINGAPVTSHYPAPIRASWSNRTACKTPSWRR